MPHSHIVHTLIVHLYTTFKITKKTAAPRPQAYSSYLNIWGRYLKQLRCKFLKNGKFGERWVVLTCIFTWSQSCCFLLHHADASSCFLKASLLHLMSGCFLPQNHPGSKKLHMVNTELYPFLKAFLSHCMWSIGLKHMGGVLRIWE